MEKLLRPDAKGRVTLGKCSKGIIGFKRTDTQDGRIVLEPQFAVPAREMWLFKNTGALKKVKKGLRESATGEVRSLGSFAQFANEDE